MKVLTIFASLVAIASARPGSSHYPSKSYLPAVSEGNQPLDFQQVEDEKHVYFYASPNDGSYTHYRINVVPKSKKNTKVIFVKAPHHAGVIPEVVAPLSLAEDKTLVYVLLKKPIHGQSISIPANLGIKQTKPEVFFIKYNKKHEAEAQINIGIQGQHVGANVPELPNQYDFISALGNSKKHGYDYAPPSASTDKKAGSEEVLTHVDIGDEVKQEVAPEHFNIPDISDELSTKEFSHDDNKQDGAVGLGEVDEGVEPHTTVVTTNDENKDNEVSTIVELGDGIDNNQPAE